MRKESMVKIIDHDKRYELSKAQKGFFTTGRGGYAGKISAGDGCKERTN